MMSPVRRSLVPACCINRGEISCHSKWQRSTCHIACVKPRAVFRPTPRPRWLRGPGVGRDFKYCQAILPAGSLSATRVCFCQGTLLIRSSTPPAPFQGRCCYLSKRREQRARARARVEVVLVILQDIGGLLRPEHHLCSPTAPRVRFWPAVSSSCVRFSCGTELADLRVRVRAAGNHIWN